MPDITMCQIKMCPRKAECYRYRAVPTSYIKDGKVREWQGYFMGMNVETCKREGYFLEIRDRDIREEQENESK